MAWTWDDQEACVVCPMLFNVTGSLIVTEEASLQLKRDG
ncbi:hypothetical protein SNOG_10772 [Parastagonospora nodorum SN15]|uniref:Uncharacterized protein n=1 Tax=Phaeosphaeria nodorum (strain SN15 / ATCC MYA-4574 / FGSC 10173) TaxID=321614 RepID=Q0UBU2_PHANO|nr:hypothetical protein SNOG_10772 [Parastagonospora nodorum SN15]EAT82166.1 hypothetical protein SNOG_10772 [Parastagonospora nodorum SN15]